MEDFTYFNSLSSLDIFLFNTQSFWYWLALIVCLLRLVLNWLIHVKTESPSVREVSSNGSFLNEIIPKTPDETERELQNSYSGTPGMRDFEFMEFMLICLFSFWWKIRPDDKRGVARLKRWSNVLNLAFIPLLTLIIVMFLRLQDLNHRLPYSTRDVFYFLK